MSQMDKLPNLHNIKKRAEKMQKDCQKWDALISINGVSHNNENWYIIEKNLNNS